MTRWLDAAYFGRLDRMSFFVMVAGSTAGAVLAIFLLLIGSGGGEAAGALDAIWRNGNPLALPNTLLAHGLSEVRTAAVVAAVSIHLIGLLFLSAARARDAGLGGWRTAAAVLVIGLVGSQSGVWAGLPAVLVLGALLLWPSAQRH